MRPVLFSVAALLSLAMAKPQIEIPDDIDLPDNINPDDIPSDITNNLPSDLPSEIPADVVSAAESGGEQLATPTPSGDSDSSSSSGDGDDSFAGLVSQLPDCAVGCLEQAAKDVGCGNTDFECLCSSGENLATQMGPCVLTAGCRVDDAKAAGELAPKICRSLDDASDSEKSSASAIVSNAIASNTASASNDDDDDDSGAAQMSAVGAGLFGSMLLTLFAV